MTRLPAHGIRWCALALFVGLATSCTPPGTSDATSSTATTTATTAGPSATTSTTGSPEPTQSATSEAGTATEDPDQPSVTAPVPTSAGEQAATVTITYAAARSNGDVIVGAYADVVAQGYCELTLTGPGGTVNLGASAVPDVTTSACAEMVVDAASLSPGTWSATVEFSGGGYRGVSEAYSLEVK